ncbi:unnamed protein product [Didymodactylos carnosus]|uniref:Uncharacterized protein n=1 Tax=Didymodactylos carnosus TaxID=1234261 RepID=A0A814IJG6_9BILA|nr:unnamed protein product [Didymodactylos carnosus]CAF1022409.1 unnamed protein product [Didymodactylos carnosus]CAF3519460.1 unnamed protein product [Didymodactylos carnosus]CAF3793752.1 unnamed protein product [Didymodactylos carnosus]
MINWYLQQHGSFSSGGRSRDISLTHFPSTQKLTEYLVHNINDNYKQVAVTSTQYNLFDLCRVAIEESNKLLAANIDEIRRVTSRHIWPPNHKLLMGFLLNAHIVATCHDEFASNVEAQREEEQENEDTNYCLITQLGNHPTDVKFLRGTNSVREEILQRFKHPFGTNSAPSQEQIDLFLHKSQTSSIQQFCNYATGHAWQHLGSNSLHGVLVDFIIASETLFFNEELKAISFDTRISEFKK